MNKPIKTYKVAIFGDQYLLASDGEESRVYESVALVNTAMHDTSKQLSLKDGKKVAVLTALSLAEKQIALQEFGEKNQELVANLNNRLFNAIEFLCTL